MVVLEDVCELCWNWNPWHHPYTQHYGLCPLYKDEPEAAKIANRVFNEQGGFYNGGPWPTAEEVMAIRGDDFRGFGREK